MKPRSLLFAIALLLIPLTPAFAAEPASIFHQFGNLKIYGDGPHYLDLGLGGFDVDGESSGAARVELRCGKKVFFVGPAIGLLANTDGGFFAYGGIYADIVYRKLVVTPFWGAGGYEEGDGKDLGGTFQFRTSITLAYQFDNLSRLGVQAAHISNADLHKDNPGAQNILLTFALPF